MGPIWAQARGPGGQDDTGLRYSAAGAVHWPQKVEGVGAVHLPCAGASKTSKHMLQVASFSGVRRTCKAVEKVRHQGRPVRVHGTGHISISPSACNRCLRVDGRTSQQRACCSTTPSTLHSRMRQA